MSTYEVHNEIPRRRSTRIRASSQPSTAPSRPRTPMNRTSRASGGPPPPALLSARIIREADEDGDIPAVTPASSRAFSISSAAGTHKGSLILPAGASPFIDANGGASPRQLPASPKRRSSVIIIDLNEIGTEGYRWSTRLLAGFLFLTAIFVLMHMFLPTGWRTAYYEFVTRLLVALRQGLVNRPASWALDRIKPWCQAACRAAGHVGSQCACFREYALDLKSRANEAMSAAGTADLESVLVEAGLPLTE